jgi:predicted ATPase
LRLVRRHSTSHPRNFEIELEFSLEGGATAIYAVKIDSKTETEFRIAREKLVVGAVRGPVKPPTKQSFVAQDAPATFSPAWYEVEDGEVVRSSVANMPPGAPDRLYLVTASGLREFRAAYDSLVSMGFYNLNPEAMKRPQSPDAGELLHRDGWNIASVVARLERDAPQLKQRVVEYLRIIVPGVQDFRRVELGPQEPFSSTKRSKAPRIPGRSTPWRCPMARSARWAR